MRFKDCCIAKKQQMKEHEAESGGKIGENHGLGN